MKSFVKNHNEKKNVTFSDMIWQEIQSEKRWSI